MEEKWSGGWEASYYISIQSLKGDRREEEEKTKMNGIHGV